MYAKPLQILVVVAFLVLGPPPAMAADQCLCTQRVDFQTANGPQNWFVAADASGTLRITLALEISTTNTGQVNADQLNAAIYNTAGVLMDTIAISGTVPGWVRDDVTITATPGEIYRIEIDRAVPHPSPQHGSRYWLRLDGASDAAIDGPLKSLNGGRTTWTLFADAGDTMGVRVSEAATYSNPPDNYPVMYQWIAPDGTAQPIGSYTVAGPPIDTMIPPPAGLVPGKWQLRLQTLSFAGPGFGYVIEKLTGIDRRLHVEPGLAGLGLGGRVRFVNQFGAPFTDPVGFTFGFGESFTFAIPGGTFETTSEGDVFPVPVSITPPAGMVATPAHFAFLSPCDGFFEQTVVIAPPPPVIAVAPSPEMLWPPNNKMRTVSVAIEASSPAGNPTTVELVSIVSNEPGGAADVAGAAFGTDDRTFQLRATRLGGGGGRVYTVTYRVTDTVTGGTTTATATVVVPHAMGQ